MSAQIVKQPKRTLTAHIFMTHRYQYNTLTSKDTIYVIGVILAVNKALGDLWVLPW